MKKIKEYFYTFVIVIIFLLFTFPVLTIYDVYFRNTDKYSSKEINQILSKLDNIEENFTKKLGLDENDKARIIESSPVALNFASYIKDTLLFQQKLNQIMNSSLDYIFDHPEDFMNINDTSEISLILNSQIIFMAYNKAHLYIINSDNEKSIEQSFIKTINDTAPIILNEYWLLRSKSLSNSAFEIARIKQLVEWWMYVKLIDDYNLNLFENGLNQKILYEDLQYFISEIYKRGSPTLGFHCLSRIAEIQFSQKKYNESIQTIISAIKLLEDYNNNLKYTELEYDIIMHPLQKAKLVLLTSIAATQSIEHTFDHLQSVINNIELKLKKSSTSYIKYVTEYRGYYMHFIDLFSDFQIGNDNARHEKSYLFKRIFNDRPIIDWIFKTWNDEKMTIDNLEKNQQYVLDIIERNKARLFKKEVNVEWIDTFPSLKIDQIGINYIKGNKITLGQIYQFNKNPETFYIDNNKLESTWKEINKDLKISEWDSSIINEKHKLQIESLYNLIIPKDYQAIIKNKHLIISPDGMLSDIPFHYIFKQDNMLSITRIPGFTYFNNKPIKINNLCAVSASNPKYDTQNFDNSCTVEYKPIPYAKTEVDRIIKNKTDLNYILKHDVTEKWVKNNINDVPHLYVFREPRVAPVPT